MTEEFSNACNLVILIAQVCYLDITSCDSFQRTELEQFIQLRAPFITGYFYNVFYRSYLIMLSIFTLLYAII